MTQRSEAVRYADSILQHLDRCQFSQAALDDVLAIDDGSMSDAERTILRELSMGVRVARMLSRRAERVLSFKRVASIAT